MKAKLKWKSKCLLDLVLILVFSTPLLAQQDIKQRLSTAMSQLRQGDASSLEKLEQTPRILLPYLAHYAKDPKMEVRRAVSSIASSVRSPQSIKVLALMINDADDQIGGEVVKILYDEYDCESLRKVGGPALRDQLAANLRRYESPRSVLLFSCFAPTKRTTHLLREMRQKVGHDESTIEPELPSVHYGLFIDIALCRLGDSDATHRLLHALRGGQIGDVDAILYTLRFVENRAVMVQCVELLRDQRHMAPNYSSNPQIKLPRVSDLALGILAARTKIPLGFETGGISTHEYTEEQTRTAYERLRAYFKK